MTVTNAYSRQPTKQDYASPTQFKFQITKLPNFFRQNDVINKFTIKIKMLKIKKEKK